MSENSDCWKTGAPSSHSSRLDHPWRSDGLFWLRVAANSLSRRNNLWTDQYGVKISMADRGKLSRNPKPCFLDLFRYREQHKPVTSGSKQVNHGQSCFELDTACMEDKDISAAGDSNEKMKIEEDFRRTLAWYSMKFSMIFWYSALLCTWALHGDRTATLQVCILQWSFQIPLGIQGLYEECMVLLGIIWYIMYLCIYIYICICIYMYIRICITSTIYIYSNEI